MDSECNMVSQKRRVGVDEGLYDFTFDELEFIHRSRCEWEEEEEGQKDCKYAENNNDTTISYRDTNSDTESTCQGKEETFFFDESEDEKKIMTSYNQFCPSPTTTDSSSDYPEIENIRWNDTGTNFQICESPVMKASSGSKTNLLQSYCRSSSIDEDQVDFRRLTQKKTLVPEPELSDPHFPGFDDSIEEERPCQSAQDLDGMKPTLQHRISTTFGSFRRSFKGGYFGSYAVQAQINQGSLAGSTQQLQVRNNGFFRIWFTKFQNRHYL